MKNYIKKLTIFSSIITAGLFTTSSQAALYDRGNGMIFDDTLNITWLQDADYAKTSGYDADGKMSWSQANDWADGLVYDGYSDWRLPNIIDLGNDGCNNDHAGGTDCGYNVITSTSEMASLSYDTLGNLAIYDTSGNIPQPGYGVSNAGPFINIGESSYWSAQSNVASGNAAWSFSFHYGHQGPNFKHYEFNAWAVHDGDIAASAVPVPAAAWLFGSALVGLGLIRKR